VSETWVRRGIGQQRGDAGERRVRFGVEDVDGPHSRARAVVCQWSLVFLSRRIDENVGSGWRRREERRREGREERVEI
jgi:hypothetical protein